MSKVPALFILLVSMPISTVCSESGIAKDNLFTLLKSSFNILLLASVVTSIVTISLLLTDNAYVFLKAFTYELYSSYLILTESLTIKLLSVPLFFLSLTSTLDFL